MDFHFIWQAVLIVLIGTTLLRIAGRKTISEMTLAETVLMISIGTLIIQPVTSKSVWKSFLVGLILVLTLLVMEYAQIKSNRLEKLITGKSKIVIENGKIDKKELLKLHMTIDQLEMHLRQNNITSIDNVKTATIEPSGRLGFTLNESAKPATKKDIEQLQHSIDQLFIHITGNSVSGDMKRKQDSPTDNDLFSEVKNGAQTKKSPEHLQ